VQTIVNSGTVVTGPVEGTPDIAADLNGVYVAFVDSRGGNNEIFYTMSDDGGNTWCGAPTVCGTTDAQVSSVDGITSEAVSISADDFPGSATRGWGAIAWHDYRDSHLDATCGCWIIAPQVYLLITADAGDSWSAELRQSAALGVTPDWRAMNPSVDFTNNLLSVVWDDDRDDGVMRAAGGIGAAPVPDWGALSKKIYLNSITFVGFIGNYVHYHLRLSFHSTVINSQSTYARIVSEPNGQTQDIYVMYQNGWGMAWEPARMKKGLNSGISWMPDDKWGLLVVNGISLAVDHYTDCVLHMLRNTNGGTWYSRVSDNTCATQ